GPSGVGSIDCSLDGGPEASYPSSSIRIPVRGLGAHHVSCVARNRAIDSSNKAATSQQANWTLTIRKPSVSAVSFTRITNKLRCARRRERVHVPARWTYERINGHRVRVRIPAQTRTIKVTRCHPRIVKKRVKIGGRW